MSEVDKPEETIFKESIFVSKTAKKDHTILQNGFRVDIKKGDDLSEVPEMYFQTLKTEQVI